jgi:hypothetical protein
LPETFGKGKAPQVCSVEVLHRYLEELREEKRREEKRIGKNQRRKQRRRKARFRKGESKDVIYESRE